MNKEEPIPALNRLRQKRKQKETAYGLWCTLEAPSIAEIAVTLDLDWIGIDMEHGHLDWKDVMNHVRTVRGSETAVFVRVPEIQESLVKRALDIGAHGVFLPLVRSVEDLERGMAFARYAPKGQRGVGGERAVKWGLGFRDYLEIANEQLMVIPLIETRGAAENIDDLLNVEGLEAILFGPADLSADHGYLGDWEGPGMAELILDIRARAEAKGVGSAIMSTTMEDAISRRDQGFAMVGLGSDAGMMIRSIRKTLGELGVEAQPHKWF